MTALPTGSVAFLFTDVVGSTSLWEHRPAEMQAAIARHDAIVAGDVTRRFAPSMAT